MLASPNTYLSNEGARQSSARQAITPASYEEGTLAENYNAATGERGYRNTIAHPEGPYMQINPYNKLRQGLSPSGEFVEWMEDAALHNPRPHF